MVREVRREGDRKERQMGAHVEGSRNQGIPACDNVSRIISKNQTHVNNDVRVCVRYTRISSKPNENSRKNFKGDLLRNVSEFEEV